jgi:hypothetical protein
MPVSTLEPPNALAYIDLCPADTLPRA